MRCLLYKRYVLITLTAVYTLSFMDRIMIGILMQPIKEDLLLSDTQLGFLTGIAFASFYAVMGIPIARWADRGNRVRIISLAMGLWGLMVLLCGWAINFLQLVLVRIGAAVGEAGCMPPSNSLIGDYFSVSERTRAFSIYMTGIPISLVLGFILAGWINELYGWRAAFIVIGVPGFLMAILMRFTVKEPRKQQVLTEAEQVIPLLDVFASLWRQKTYRYLIIASVLFNFAGIGVGQWHATFFIRSHGMTTGELGLWMGLIGGLSGVVGTFFGGYLLDHYWSGNLRTQLRIIGVGVALLFPTVGLLLFVPNQLFALMMLVPLNLFGFFVMGPVIALLQRLVADRLRAVSIAIYLLLLNLIGMGLGPQAVGILSDTLHPLLATDALPVAMLLSEVVIFGSAFYFWRAGQTVNDDLLAVEKYRGRLDSTVTDQLSVSAVSDINHLKSEGAL